MKIKRHRIKNFEEFHRNITSTSSGLEGIGRLFRGQNNAEWKLVPKGGRDYFADINLQVYFYEWKSRALEFIEKRPQDDWDWLAIAQHHGLATNLLDWTYNPLVAAFFAVEEDSDTDAAIFSFQPNKVVSLPSVGDHIDKP